MFQIQRGRALIVDFLSSGGARTNLANGMGAPTSSLASLEWRPRIAHRTAKGAPYGFTAEKDNGIPSLDRQASGHEKRSQCKQTHPPHGSSRSKKKVPETLRGFVSEKMKENEP
jgi:hypothetical protein